MPSVDAILDGPPVMKLLFMTDPKVVDAKLKPDWQVGTAWPCPTCVGVAAASTVCLLLSV